ncbi:hypothetical protein BI334_21775 [Moorena producens 3L]|nr:hypothetical protein BI334_21775 [Moorena producens 3L]
MTEVGDGKEQPDGKYSAISYQLSAISYQLSAISYQLSAISYQSKALAYGHPTGMGTLLEMLSAFESNR